MVLVMSVMPGFGGQAFDDRALEKLRTLRSTHPNLLLEVDGGVNAKTAAACGEAGAHMLVAGAAIFKNPGHDYASSIRQLAELASQ
jgi:ribulose-phosphate 3-epimerase